MDGPVQPTPLVHAATRFMPPRLRPEFVFRSSLVDRILSPDARLVFASGPAGSGKSTLLAQAHAVSSHAVWLSVQPSDDDPAVLWSALIDSTAGTLPGFGRQYRHRLDVGGGEAVDGILPLFVNELADSSRQICFFLDDVHLLSGDRSVESLRRLVEQLPPQGRVVMASRAASPFPLGRLRLQRSLLELGPTDLAMDLEEASAALSAAGIESDEDQLVSLVDRTEGWVAGLAWATLVMQANPDGKAVVDAVDSVDGELAAYLIEEVLDQQSADVRNFMLDTSLLTRFSAPLCDELRRRKDSRNLIDELDRTNLFLVPLDRHGEWFRYHHLVHEVLASRLARESPDRVPTLHRRASAWFHDNHEIVESFHHARAAGDHLRAADILCENWWGMMNGGRIETAYALFEEFGHVEICAYQPLSIAAALLYSLAGDHQRGQEYYRAAEAGSFDGPPPDGSASIESALAIMRGGVAFDGVDAVLVAGKRAFELEPVESPWRPLAVFLVALGHVWRGEIDLAEPKLHEAIGSGHANDAVVVYALAQLALIRVARGDLQGGLADAESACAHAEDTGLESVFVTAMAHGAAATAKLATGDSRGAERHLDDARGPMAGVSTAMPIDAMHTRLVLADASIQLGRMSEAKRYVDAAADTARQYEDTGVLAALLLVVSERLENAGRPEPAVLSDREQSVLELMPSELSIREIADALYVSKETVKTHRRRIYQKLSVTSRADAVVAARRSGLLPEFSGSPAHTHPADA